MSERETVGWVLYNGLMDSDGCASYLYEDRTGVDWGDKASAKVFATKAEAIEFRNAQHYKPGDTFYPAVRRRTRKEKPDNELVGPVRIDIRGTTQTISISAEPGTTLRFDSDVSIKVIGGSVRFDGLSIGITNG